MTKLAITAMILGALLAFVGASFGGGEACRRAAAERFVVHEWGTFTSLQGSDGVSLEGLEHEEESLPDFVYDRAKIRECPLRAVGWKGLEQPVDGVTQKMETPVIYFHSPTARRVRVRVDFKDGLISQWYPVTDLLGPPEGKREDGPLDMAKIDRSFLEWEVDVLAPDAAEPSEVPKLAGKDDPWLFAREVAANWLRTAPRHTPERAGPVEAERYLFYRGLGRFTLPVEVRAESDGKGTLINSKNAYPLTGVIALEVRGDRGRIQFIDTVPAKGVVSFAHGGADYWGPISEVSEKLAALLHNLLTQQGLNSDEARAMVRTWSRSWFTNEGSRLLYIVPRPLVDEMLPLSITPPPAETVRVLLGRLEYLTPEVEAEVEQALIARTTGEAAGRGVADERLARLGRFLEPHLRRTLAHSRNVDARANALALLTELEKEARPRP
ncbi:MAG: hypothetical protein ACKVX7_14285 [Planctomycetota bacterium]